MQNHFTKIPVYAKGDETAKASVLVKLKSEKAYSVLGSGNSASCVK